MIDKTVSDLRNKFSNGICSHNINNNQISSKYFSCNGNFGIISLNTFNFFKYTNQDFFLIIEIFLIKRDLDHSIRDGRS